MANLSACRGVAIREFPLKSGYGFADYLLYVDGAPAGVIEAKKEGETLTGYEIQTEKYSVGLPDVLKPYRKPLPFCYQSTGIETRFTNLMEPDARSRPVFAVHRPETLADWLLNEAKKPGSTLRARLRHMPPLGSTATPGCDANSTGRSACATTDLWRAQANLKHYRAAVLKAAVEGRLVPTEAELARREGRSYEPASELLKRLVAQPLLAVTQTAQAGVPVLPKARRREPAAPDTANLPKLPEGWAWTTMPEIGELNRGKSKHRPRDDARLFGGPYPFIQTGDVKRSGGHIRSHTQTYSEAGLAQSRLWPAGTLCITIAANIAESGILTYPACFPDSVVGFTMEQHTETVRFCQLFLETAKGDLARFAPETAQKNINLETLNALAVALPPLAEQRRIVAEVERRLSVIDELEMQVEANLKRAERLRQAILKRTFEGKLAPQDPNDEPASALLERIKAAKANSTATPGCGRKK
jgi:type I restriction enzyme S subunit